MGRWRARRGNTRTRRTADARHPARRFLDPPCGKKTGRGHVCAPGRQNFNAGEEQPATPRTMDACAPSGAATRAALHPAATTERWANERQVQDPHDRQGTGNRFQHVMSASPAWHATEGQRVPSVDAMHAALRATCGSCWDACGVAGCADGIAQNTRALPSPIGQRISGNK